MTNFKNYDHKSFEFADGFNLLYGPNGSGKTNILDAIHYLALAKSHFVPQDKLAIKNGSDFFRLEGNLKNSGQRHKVILTYVSSHKKIVFDDQPAIRMADHVGKIGLVMIAPDDLEIIDGLSALRRKYMDIALVQTNHQYLLHLSLYKKLLDQRNAYLKQAHPLDHLFLEVLNEKMAPHALELYQLRAGFARDFIPFFNKYYQAISGDKEKVEIRFKSDLEYESLIDLFHNSYAHDVRIQYTSKGCHKDDLQFLIHDQEVKYVASQGQKKTFLVSLFLAQADYLAHTMSSAPIILLDDVFDKLDPVRVKYLMSTLKGMPGSQIIMTDTTQERIIPIIRDLDIEGRFFSMDNIA